jgi:hypothetical protein
MATLDALKSEDGRRAVRLRNGKSNYSPEFDDLLLVRSDEPGIEGTLRLANAAEAEGFDEDRAVTDEELQRRVLNTVNTHTGLTSATEIVELTQGTRKKLLGVVKSLRFAKRLELTDDGFVVRPAPKTN